MSSYFGVDVVLRLGVALGPRLDVSEVDVWTEFASFCGGYMSANSIGSCWTTCQNRQTDVSATFIRKEYTHEAY